MLTGLSCDWSVLHRASGSDKAEHHPSSFTNFYNLSIWEEASAWQHLCVGESCLFDIWHLFAQQWKTRPDSFKRGDSVRATARAERKDVIYRGRERPSERQKEQGGWKDEKKEQRIEVKKRKESQMSLKRIPRCTIWLGCLGFSHS